MSADNFSKSRAERLDRIVSGASISDEFPLLKVLPVHEALFATLRSAMNVYLWNSLTSWYEGQVFSLSENVLEDYTSEILKLPNRTPNGVLLPKYETFLSYNLVHRAFARIIKAFGLDRSFHSLQLPYNIRIVSFSGEADEVAAARPYASSKIHTDIWAGEPWSHLLLNLPVLGDPDGIAMEFFELKQSDSNMFPLLADYADAAIRPENISPYDVAFRIGHLYVSDSFSLHQTALKRPGVRLSIDLRAIVRDIMEGETHDAPNSRATYVDTAAWLASGSRTVLATGHPIESFQRGQQGEAPPVKLVTLNTLHELDTLS